MEKIVKKDDADYPESLRHIGSPPEQLYIKGRWPLPTGSLRDYLAIVGTRRASPAGRQLSYELARAAATAGLMVVSGLAYGIDAAAHEGALSVGGWTAAVMGTGWDIVYPAGHAGLAQRIRGRGALITEFPPGTPSLRQNFPCRNRLISGLSAGVVVIDAAPTSGAMITAKFALEQGREVMAVPGQPGRPLSQGPNWLIKQGGALVENIDDILAALGRLDQVGAVSRKPLPSQLPPGLSEVESAVWLLLQGGPIAVDEIVARTGRTVPQVMAVLLGLRLKSLVREGPGQRFTSSLA